MLRLDRQTWVTSGSTLTMVFNILNHLNTQNIHLYSKCIFWVINTGKWYYTVQDAKRTINVVNLDPAAEFFNYQPLADIRDLIQVCFKKIFITLCLFVLKGGWCYGRWRAQIWTQWWTCFCHGVSLGEPGVAGGEPGRGGRRLHPLWLPWSDWALHPHGCYEETGGHPASLEL